MRKNYISKWHLLFFVLFLECFSSGNNSYAATVDGSGITLVLTGVFVDSDANNIASPGDYINYTFTVTNTGTENLTGVIISDLMLQPSQIQVSSLLPGGTTIAIAAFYITQSSIDNGFVINSASVSATAGSGTVSDVSDDGDASNGNNSPTVTPLIQSPQLELIKTAVSNGISGAGDSIAYTFTITNTGNVTVSDVTINDPMLTPSSITLQPNTLAPGAAAVVTMIYIITDSDAMSGSVTNSATAFAQTPFGGTVSDVSDNGIPFDGTDNPTVTPIATTLGGLVIEGTYNDYNNDGFINIGDVMNYQISVSNSGNNPLVNVFVSSPDFEVSGDPVAQLNPGETNSTAFTGFHVINQADITAITVFGTATLHAANMNGGDFQTVYNFYTPLGITDRIRLNAFVDGNENGTRDPEEVNFVLGDYHYEVNNNGIIHTIHQGAPFSLYDINPENSYDIGFTVDAQYAQYYNVSVSSYSDVTIVSNSGTINYYFPVTTTPYYDLSVVAYGYGMPPRPGFDYVDRICYSNTGNQTLTSGTITFTNDPNVTVTNVSEAGVTSTATGFTYNFTNLLPYETRCIEVTMHVPPIPDVSLGQLFSAVANGSTAFTDSYPQNNDSTISQMVVGSFDPNDKTESHGGKILFSNFNETDYLTYTIQFENTGTANAVNVKVIDVLDEMLDETSVKMIAASADYVMERVDNNLTWRFDGIELPPSDGSSMTGHGNVVFKVKPKPGYQLGDIIPNFASIYFDFNPAIVTNTFDTEFVSQLGVPEFENTDFVIYPNPVSDKVTIALKDNGIRIDNVTVMDLSGKTLFSKSTDDYKAVIDFSAFSNGFYLVKVKAAGKEKTIKIIRQ